jgi:hypothetical protein
MIVGLRLFTRIALFSALVYVFCWATSYLPNVNLVFFIVFSTGFLWGCLPGVLVGIIGMGLSSTFNPYGPAHPYLMLAQMNGIAFSGVIGGIFARTAWSEYNRWVLSGALALASVVCTVFYYVPVNTIDAWLVGPFWPKFYTGWAWSLISLGTNVFIFPLLFGVTRYLYDRESGSACQGS